MLTAIVMFCRVFPYTSTQSVFMGFLERHKLLHEKNVIFNVKIYYVLLFWKMITFCRIVNIYCTKVNSVSSLAQQLLSVKASLYR